MTELLLLLIIVFLGGVVGPLIAREVHERKRNGDPPLFGRKR